MCTYARLTNLNRFGGRCSIGKWQLMALLRTSFRKPIDSNRKVSSDRYLIPSSIDEMQRCEGMEMRMKAETEPIKCMANEMRKMRARRNQEYQE